MQRVTRDRRTDDPAPVAERLLERDLERSRGHDEPRRDAAGGASERLPAVAFARLEQQQLDVAAGGLARVHPRVQHAARVEHDEIVGSQQLDEVCEHAVLDLAALAVQHEQP